MKKPFRKLKKGDKLAVVSLSLGILGENFSSHQRKIAEDRMREIYGIELVYMPNSLKGIKYLDEHPEKRAEDLKSAFKDDSIAGIITAIGGMDTYRTFEYLFEDEEFKQLILEKPKLFTGFSDTSMNHLMFQKLGLNTVYGPSLLADIAELEDTMLPYTKEYFDLYFEDNDGFEIKPAETWYSSRNSFGEDQIGVNRTRFKEEHGYEVINGSGEFRGKLYGGCLDTLGDAFLDFIDRGVNKIVEKYEVLPTLEEWKEKILFLETSEEKMHPEKFELILNELKNRGILGALQGVLVGKPADETYYEEYKEILKNVFNDLDTPVLYNLNFGHSYPRTILPYGLETVVNLDEKTVKIVESIFDK